MIKIQDDIKVWITSDTHYKHTNICRGITKWRTPDGEIPVMETRDFSTLDKMNDTIVTNINKVVQQEDVLIHLGDWSFGGFESIREFYDRIICKNIYLILGNHDQHIKKDRQGIQEIFKLVSKYETLSYKGKTFRLMHYPFSSWDGLAKGDIHLHGHTHLSGMTRFGKGKRMDVGIDGHPEFRPYDLFREVIPIMEKQPIKSEMDYDHHTSELKNVIG